MLKTRNFYIIIFCIFILYLILIIGRHYTFNSSAYDLGIYNQLLYNISNGNGYTSSLESKNYFGDHIIPLLYILAVFYKIFPTPLFLLISQLIIIFACCIYIYKISLYFELDKKIAYFICLIFLLYPNIGFIIRFDFHTDSFALFFLFALIYYTLINNVFLSFVFFILSAISKENYALFASLFYLFIIFGDLFLKDYLKKNYFLKINLTIRTKIIYLIIAIIGMIYTLTAIYWIIPFFRQENWDTFQRYSYLKKKSLSDIMFFIFGAKEHFIYFIKLFLPLAFLPALYAPLLLFIPLPAFIYNLTSTNLSQSSIYFHYSIPIIVFLFLAFIISIKKINNKNIYSLIILSLFLCFLIDNPFIKITSYPYYPTYPIIKRRPYKDLLSMKKLIEKNASVATTDYYIPHLSNRRYIYQYPWHKKNIEKKYDYILLDKNDYRWTIKKDFYNSIENLKKNNNYVLRKQIKGLMLFKKKHK